MAELLLPSNDDVNHEPKTWFTRDVRSPKQRILFAAELLAAIFFLGAASIITVGGFLHDHPDPWNAIGGILWILGSILIIVILLLAWYWKTKRSYHCPSYQHS